MADACECGNEPSGSVKCGEFLDYFLPVFCKFSIGFYLHILLMSSLIGIPFVRLQYQ